MSEHDEQKQPKKKRQTKSPPVDHRHWSVTPSYFLFTIILTSVASYGILAYVNPVTQHCPQVIRVDCQGISKQVGNEEYHTASHREKTHNKTKSVDDTQLGETTTPNLENEGHHQTIALGENLTISLTSPSPSAGVEYSSNKKKVFRNGTTPGPLFPKPQTCPPPKSCRGEVQRAVFSIRRNNAPSLSLESNYQTILQDPLASVNLTQSSLLRRNGLTAFYVWCGNRPFEFRHYLSVISLATYLSPSLILFYYESPPVLDGSRYNSWFEELQERLPFLEPRTLPLGDDGQGLEKACSSDNTPLWDFVKKELCRHGGQAFYMSTETILTERFASLPLDNYSTVYSPPDLPDRLADFGADAHFLLAWENFSSKGRKKRKKTKLGGRGGRCDPLGEVKRGSDREREARSLRLNCQRVASPDKQAPLTDQGESPLDNIHCMRISFDLMPLQNVEKLPGAVRRRINRLFYGSDETPRPRPDYNLPDIPRIGYIVHIGGGDISCLAYLGILSLLYVAKLKEVYVLGDLEPEGYHWSLLIDRGEAVEFIRRDVSDGVYRRYVSNRSHMSDVWRVDFMIKYGGLYMDQDAMFINPIPDDLFHYDAVASFDWPTDAPFPNVFNFGVTMGRRGAKFWRLFQQTMKTFEDGEWTLNPLRRPYQVYERYPHLIRVDPHFQVICFYSKCHPTWWPNYHDEKLNHLHRRGNRPINWTADMAALHFTHPTPYELETIDRVLTERALFAELARGILKRAGVLEMLMTERNKNISPLKRKNISNITLHGLGRHRRRREG